MAYIIRTAKRDFTSSFGVKVKKGQKYVDKGFGSIVVLNLGLKEK